MLIPTLIGSRSASEHRSMGVRVDSTSPPDHAELVERLIRSEKQNRLLERTIRELQQLYADDPNANYAAVLVSRIVTLEANVDKLSRRKAA